MQRFVPTDILSNFHWFCWKLRCLFWTTDITPIRFFIACSSVLWGILLFWPGDTFSRPTYFIMAKFASENMWAGLFSLSGFIGLMSIFYDVKHKISLIGEALLGVTLWSSSCIAMLLSVYPPPAAISAEVVAAISSWWILVRYPSDWSKLHGK